MEDRDGMPHGPGPLSRKVPTEIRAETVQPQHTNLTYSSVLSILRKSIDTFENGAV